MSPSSAEARHIRTTHLVGFFVLLAVAAALGVGAQSFARSTAVVCALLMVASLTWYSPLGATRVALIMLFVTPFLEVIPQLKPQQVNYSVYYGLAVFAVAVVICAKARRFAFDSGAVLLAAVLVSAFVTLLAGEALATDYGYVLWPLTTLAVYLLVLNSSEDGHSWLLILILAFSLSQSVLGISQSLLHWPVFSVAAPSLFESDRGMLGYVLPGFSRMVGNGSGTYQHFNGLGGLLALALPISFGWLLENPRSFQRLLPCAILATGLLMTYSRAGWAGGTVGCILAYWASRPRASRTWIPLLSAGVLLVAASLAPYIAAYYVATQNVSSRLITWRYAVDYWLQHSERLPFGFGFGSFGQTILKQSVSLGGRTLPTIHSGFLQILLEMGIAGLILFGWFLVSTIRPFVVRRPGWQAWALGGIVGFLASQILDNSLFLMTGTCVFALAACLRRADARHDVGESA